MTDQTAACRTTQHCATHGFCHRCAPSLHKATQHLVKAIDAAGIEYRASGPVYAKLAATVRDAARQAAGQPATETHPGYDIAGYPETHAGPREKCPDPACETDQHENCGPECPAVGLAAPTNHTTEAEARCCDVQVWPLARVLRDVRCGSKDWTWDEEWADLDERHAETGYLDTLEQQIRADGITMPVLVGSDGRLWDGHHRLRIAVRLGIDCVPVEVTPPPPRAAGAES